MLTLNRRPSVKAEPGPSQSSHLGDLYDVCIRAHVSEETISDTQQLMYLPHQPAEPQTLPTGVEEDVSVSTYTNHA